VLTAQLRKRLRQVADSTKAPGMQAYMKSSMPYLGVPAVPLRAICKRLFGEIELKNARQWERLVLGLWENAKYREERYAALNLLEDHRALPFQKVATLKLYEKLIVEGAWWDYVDLIASHRVGYLLDTYPVPLKKKMLAWSRCDNLWQRRTSILCQLSFKEHTDLELLYGCIAPSLDSKEFFLQKAIGWALRQYAWTNPREVKRYVKTHSAELSSLSKREALKNL